MAEVIAPTTKLDAVNICLSSMGEPDINSLDDAAMDAGMASAVIDETSSSVQMTGWYWNTEVHTLAPSANDGSILLPNNLIRLVDYDKRLGNLVQRGLRLYNTDTGSFVFSGPLKLRMTVLLVFDDLPLTAKQFIAIRSARIFQQRVLGSEMLVKFDASDEERAWTVLMQEEAETMKANVLTDNWSSQSIVSRWRFIRGMYG